MTAPELAADGLTAGYPARPVLAAVTLAVRPGELLAVIGPNGAGKTTLLKALARQLRPAAGAVTLGGVALWSRGPGWAARHVGFATQRPPTDRPLTVAEAVALGRAPHRGWLLPLTAEDHAAVARAVEAAGLTHLAGRGVNELSDGEAQRVGLARALAQEPAVLLVDEPTAHLDLRYQGETLDQLRRLARGGMAVAAALHDLNLAGLWADRVALLVAGRLVAVGPPGEVFTAERLGAAYGTPLSVTRHPEFGTPLVLPTARAASPRESPMTRRTALAALLLVALAPGCRRPVADAAVSAEPSPGFPVAVTDSFGATLTLPSKPLRVVSLATSNTELVFAVGAGDAVVGVTTFCDYPPAAADREKVGQFMPSTFNLERIVALRPDLVLTTGTVQVPLTESLRRLGLPVLSFDAQDLAGVARNVRAVGTATGHAEAADRLATTLEARAEAVRGRTDAIPVEQRPTVLLLLDDVSMLSAGPKSFPGRLVELAGGRNLFADATQDYPRVSAEQVVRRNPDALLLWHAVTPAGRWADLPAVKNGRVLRIDEDLISRPGPRLFDGLERLADLLHPAKKP